MDNPLVIFLNGEMIRDSGIIHDHPEMYNQEEIANLLNQHENSPTN